MKLRKDAIGKYCICILYVLRSYLQSEFTKLQFSCGQVCVKPGSYSQQSKQILPRVPDVVIKEVLTVNGINEPTVSTMPLSGASCAEKSSIFSYSHREVQQQL